MADTPSTEETPYTLADIRDLLQFKVDAEIHSNNIWRMNKGLYPDTSELQSFQEWVDVTAPTPGRLAEDIALTLPLYRRFLKAARRDYHVDLSPTLLTAIVSEVLNGPPVWAMNLEVFEKVWDARDKSAGAAHEDGEPEGDEVFSEETTQVPARYAPKGPEPPVSQLEEAARSIADFFSRFGKKREGVGFVLRYSVAVAEKVNDTPRAESHLCRNDFRWAAQRLVEAGFLTVVEASPAVVIDVLALNEAVGEGSLQVDEAGNWLREFAKPKEPTPHLKGMDDFFHRWRMGEGFFGRKTPSQPKTKVVSEREALFEQIRALKTRQNMTPASIRKWVETPEGKDLREAIHAEIERTPFTKSNKPNSIGAIIDAALVSTYESQRNKRRR